jgi:hypothetical protein
MQNGVLMIRLTNSIAAWGTPEFAAVLKRELQGLGGDGLPLQQGLSASSQVADAPIEVLILRVADEGEAILVKAGVFYSGVIAGCSCADDPTPVGENTEYCELRLHIHKGSGEARVAPWD